MSRHIDFNQPLKEEDREYIKNRPWLYRGQSFEDLEFEGSDEDPDEDLDTDPADENPEDVDPDEDEDLDEDEDEDLEEDEDDEDEEDEESLEDLTIPDLKDIAKERGIKVPSGINKEDLIELLS